jgi:hypothetical protein
LSAVRQRVADSELDALLVTGPENITYLSGYQTTGYYYLQVPVVPVEAEPFMVCRLLENSNVEARTWLEYSRPFQDVVEPTERLAEALCESGLGQGRIGSLFPPPSASRRAGTVTLRAPPWSTDFESTMRRWTARWRIVRRGLAPPGLSRSPMPTPPPSSRPPSDPTRCSPATSTISVASPNTWGIELNVVRI